MGQKTPDHFKQKDGGGSEVGARSTYKAQRGGGKLLFHVGVETHDGGILAAKLTVRGRITNRFCVGVLKWLLCLETWPPTLQSAGEAVRILQYWGRKHDLSRRKTEIRPTVGFGVRTRWK